MKTSMIRAAALVGAVAVTALLFQSGALFGLELSSRLARPEWLAANLTNPNVRIIDMRGDIREYWESHIPGALYLDSESLRWPERGVPSKLMPPGALAQILGEMGIEKNTTIIIYSEINSYRATYLAWALDCFSHRSWAILENGFDGWKKQNLPLTQDYPAIEPVKYKGKEEYDPAVRAVLADVKNRDRSRAVLLDVRSRDLYAGEKGSWKRKGHIPGAINRFWADNLTANGEWKDTDLLRKSLAAIGVTSDKTIIVSCGQGQMASHTYVTLKHILGFPDIKNYDGSFTEWSNIDALAVDGLPKAP